MEQNSRHSQRKCLIRVKVSARSDFTHQQTCGGGTPVIWVCETGSVSVIIRRQFTECGSHLPHPPCCLSQSSTLAEATRSLLLLLVMNEEASSVSVCSAATRTKTQLFMFIWLFHLSGLGWGPLPPAVLSEQERSWMLNKLTIILPIFASLASRWD